MSFVLDRLDPHAESIHTHTTMINLTPQQLRKAADLQESIQSLQKEFAQLLGGPAETAETEAPKKKWKFNAAARAKMRKAQKARWAKIKETAPSVKPAKKARIQRSATWTAAVSAAAKARWAKAKKVGKSRW